MRAQASKRRAWLGSSDAAAVLGVSPHKSALGLWLEKTGAEPERMTEARRRILERGRKLEPYIVSMAVDKLREQGHEVELLQRNRRYRDKAHPFLRAEVDFELRIDGEHVNGEAKSASEFMRSQWGAEQSDDVPIAYAAQGMHGLMVTERGRTCYAAMIGIDDVRLYWLKRDEATIEGMRSLEVDFWRKHVVPKVPPAGGAYEDLRRLWPKDDDRTVEATPEIAAAVVELRRIRQEARALDARDDELCTQIAQYMGERARLTWGGEQLLTWHAESRSTFLLDDFRRQHPDFCALFTERLSARVLRLSKARGR